MESDTRQPAASPEAAPPASGSGLSERELEILRLVATGASNKEIAHKLVISPNTVKVHLRNIFAKINVASRTEATVYAIRLGLVKLPGAVGQGDSPRTAPSEAGTPSFPLTAPQADSLASPPLEGVTARRRRWWYAGGIGATIVILFLSLWIARTAQPTATTSTSPQPAPTPVRWSNKAPLPTARSALAAAAYENQIYAIGGETSSGVTGMVERYDPNVNAWQSLTAKPVAVADVNAAVVGGKIYVPGGRLASGEITNTLEVYDPRTDQWEKRAPVPSVVSAYALVAFEGRLYLFGGWNGVSYLASTYEYDPASDEWVEHTPMPSARGYLGAAVAAGRIYVIGGQNVQGILAVNEEYTPEADVRDGTPWRVRAPLPEGRSSMGVASVADLIHTVGGESAAGNSSALEYFPQADLWQTFASPRSGDWPGLALAVVETKLHAIGGKHRAELTADHLTYQILFTISLPIIQ